MVNYWARCDQSTDWSLVYLDKVFAMVVLNVADDKRRKSIAKWENDLLLAKWVVIRVAGSEVKMSDSWLPKFFGTDLSKFSDSNFIT